MIIRKRAVFFICVFYILVMLAPVLYFGWESPQFFEYYLLVGVLFISGAILTLHREIISRLKKLYREVEKIELSGDFQSRVKVAGNDALTKLAEKINQMLATLEFQHHELFKREKRISKMMEIALDGLWGTDLNGNFLYVNKSACETLGYSKEEFLKMNVKEIEVIENEEDVKNHIKKIMEKGADIFSTKHRRKNGEIIDVEMTVHYLPEENVMFAISRDITEKVKREEELKSALEKLQRTQNYLIQAEKLAALGEFALGFAHEINNPLANISSACQLCLEHCSKEDFSKEEGRKYLSIIYENAKTAGEIVKQLLNFARPDSISLKKENFKKVLEETIAQILPRCEEKKINVLKEIAEDLPEFPFDFLKIKETFLNIISNSIDSMPNGGELKISASYDAEKSLVKVIFEDNGSGIEKENLDKIFNPFFSTKKSGIGLGLALSRQIIFFHKGDIKIESKVGKGTKVIITLPVLHH